MDFYTDRNLILESNCSFKDAGFAVLGVPFDSTCSYRPGCRFGPLAIRKELLELDKPESYFAKKIYDLGNVSVVHGNLQETNRRAEETLTQALRENPKAIPITLGGEHSVSYPAIKALKEKYPNLQVAHFDAHPDLYNDYLGEKWSHATVMRRVTELGIPVVQFGVREGSDEEAAVMKKLPKKLDPKRPTYISIDIDVLEPGHCPGVGTPSPGGLIIQDLLKLLRPIKNVVGFDIVEVSPPYDKGDITSVTAAKILLELIQNAKAR